MQTTTADLYEGLYGSHPVWLKSPRDVTSIARLRDEQNLLQQLQDPSLPEGLGVIRLADRPVALLRCPTGILLSALQRRPPAAASIAIVARLASILRDLQGASLDNMPLRLVHRGLGVESVWLTAEGQVILFDLLPAKFSFADREAISSVLPLGTLAAPGARRGTAGVDVYGLGGLLLTLLTGASIPPLHIHEAHHLAQIDQLLQDAGHTDAALRGLARALLRHRAEDRPSLQDALQLLLALTGGEAAGRRACARFAQQTVPSLQAALRYRGQLQGGWVGSRWQHDERTGDYRRLQEGYTLHTAETQILRPPSAPPLNQGRDTLELPRSLSQPIPEETYLFRVKSPPEQTSTSIMPWPLSWLRGWLEKK